MQVAHHVMVFNYAGRNYGLAILSDLGSNEKVAAIAGGVLREHFPQLF